eukprot:TRINITY_DN10946_c0_g1_i1.p1 TRINITY_DN10946_c0_g1~~TRINITY_DN10946_c0_g1_i1.p1  ORF type:complete len:111 (+),score=2.57 TRINITY_DN10946_c0_g1_i1:91-423(+)
MLMHAFSRICKHRRWPTARTTHANRPHLVATPIPMHISLHATTPTSHGLLHHVHGTSARGSTDIASAIDIAHHPHAMSSPHHCNHAQSAAHRGLYVQLTIASGYTKSHNR